jgi:HSP20 family protein
MFPGESVMPWDDVNVERHFKEIEERADRIFEEMWEINRPLLLMPDQVWKPALDIYETEEEVIVQVEVAGIKKDEIEITIQGDVLSISGSRIESFPENMTRLDQMEINYGKFQRKVKILVPIDRDRISAMYENGFLKIRLPKRGKVHHYMIKVNPD